jgi:hypothetical protein
MAGQTTIQKTETPVKGKLSHSWGSSVAARKAQCAAAMPLILKLLQTSRHGLNMPQHNYKWQMKLHLHGANRTWHVKTEIA